MVSLVNNWLDYMPYISIKDKTIKLLYLETLFFFLEKSKERERGEGIEKEKKGREKDNIYRVS